MSKIRTFFAAMFMVLGCHTSFADITIDPAKTVIRYESRYGFAARELAKHLKLVTGTDIKMNSPATAPNTFVINVGKSPAGKMEQILQEEGKWFFTQDAAYFYGDGPAGTLNAIYVFLENELGIRWPTGKDIAYRKMNPIVIRNLSGAWHPVLRLREIRTAQNAVMTLWSERMLMGEHNPPRYGHAFTQWWDRFGKTHPEYFAMNKGRRFPINSNGTRSSDITMSTSRNTKTIGLCVSNDAVVKQIIADWDKKSDCINICENDTPATLQCHCKACIALDAKASQTLTNDMGADRSIHFANKVVAEARKIRPNARVTMYAYNSSELPPVNVKLSPYILVGIVPQDFRLDRLQNYVKSWKSAGMKEFFYRPNRHWYYCPMGFPLGCEKDSYDIFKFMYESGAVAFDYDAPPKYDIFRWHNDYILFHAMAHPEVPFEQWEKHYGEAYGEACDEIVEYFRYWQQVWKKRIHPKQGELANRKNWAYFSREFFPKVALFYTMDDFKRAGAILEKALRKNLSPEDRSRVMEIKKFHDHAALMLNAVVNKSAANSLAVKEFRKQHKMPAVMPYEDEFGDICGIKISELAQFLPPILNTPLFWHFRLDNALEGVKNKWFSMHDFSTWDGLMPTDSSWEKTYKHYPHPSPELRKQVAEYDGVAWYACETEIPADWKNKRRVFIYFGAVDESADVWVNGKKAGSHPFVKPKDWETPFWMDITELIDWTAKKQLVTVRVTDNEGNGGIWKRVFIVSKNKK